MAKKITKKRRKEKKKEAKAKATKRKLRRKWVKRLTKWKDVMLDKYRTIIKCLVVFGSVARDEFTKRSDADLMIILDDSQRKITPLFRKQVERFAKKKAEDISKHLHPQPPRTLTEFWYQTRRFEPLTYTVLKEGIALYDTGFFRPTKRLLEAGKIPGTREAIEKKMDRIPQRLARVKHIKVVAIVKDIYGAVLESTQAAIMYLGREPPSRSKLIKEAKEYLVDPKLLDEENFEFLKKVMNFYKAAEHKKIKKISGKELDEFIKKAEQYVKQMRKILVGLELKKKSEQIKRNYEVMVKGSIATLKSIDKLPKDPKKLPEAFDKYLVDKEKIAPIYREVFGHVLKMRKLAKEKKLNKISDRDLNTTSFYVRRFARSLRKYLKRLKRREGGGG